MSLRLPLGPLGLALALWAGGSVVDSKPAHAQSVPSETQRSRPGSLHGSRFLLGVERVSGVLGWYTLSTFENDFGRFERRRMGGQLHLLSASAHAGDGRDALNFSGIPRIAVDFMTRAGVTVGGFGALLGSTGAEELTIDGTEQPDITFPDSLTGLGGVRLGYAVRLGRTTSFWPRLGLTYAVQRLHGAAGARQTLQSLQLSIEPTFVISPVPHVGFLIHPLLDVGLGGSIQSSFVITGLPTQSTKGSFRAHAAGAAVGLVVFF